MMSSLQRQLAESSQQGLFIATYLTMYGTGKTHSQVQGKFHQATQCAASRAGLVSSKSLWTIPVLIASWSRKIFPLIASSHIQSYTVTIIDLIWNYILFYQRPQSHIWQCNKQQFCKTGEMQITWFSVLVKSQVRLKSFHWMQLSISQVI